MNKVLIIVMLVAAAGMIFGLSKQKAGVSWGKPLAVACAIVALLCAVWHISKSGDQRGQAIVTRELKFQMIAAEKLGQHLASASSGSKAILIVEPSISDGRQQAMITGLTKGFGTAITLVETTSPPIPEKAKQAYIAEMAEEEEEGEEGGGIDLGSEPIPSEYWYFASVLDQFIETNKGKADLFITAMGMPEDVGRMEFWKSPGDAKMAVLTASVSELKGVIAKGLVAGAVAYNPEAEYTEEPVPSDFEEAFSKRYILVTPDNLDSVSNLFNR